MFTINNSSSFLYNQTLNFKDEKSKLKQNWPSLSALDVPNSAVVWYTDIHKAMEGSQT